jgi:hypothetical protein
VGATYDRLADLALEVESYSLERLDLRVSPEFMRSTTVVRLRGAGVDGVGEDVTYDPAAHDALHARLADGLPPPGSWTVDSFSRALDGVELFPDTPSQDAYRNYRRWAFESAALDLALRQAGSSFGAALGRETRPVTYVVSLGLGRPPSSEPLRRLLARDPDLRFKLDATSAWTDELAAEVSELAPVDVIDLKGAYKGTPVDQAADARLYRLVAEIFPQAWIEDPNLDDPGASAALEPHRDRVTWDAPILSVEDVEALAFAPRMLNVKPSRFGTLRSLLETYDYCERRGITTYGGGQFELGPGRGQIQHLAAVFNADAPNDVAPAGFNHPSLPDELPRSPLRPPDDAVGFGWG